jgi:acyl-CoA thioesterase
VDVEVTRAGRSLVFTTVRMHQGERLLAQSMIALGHGRSELEFQDLRPPQMRLPEEIAPVEIPVGLRPPIAERFDYRQPVPAELGSLDRSDLWCWLRLVEPRPVDDAVLALMTDALAPAMFFRKVPMHVYPTIDLTVHLRNPPPVGYDDWCLAHVATRTAASGFIEEDCDVYDRSGTLLAQGRQLALMVPTS